MVFINIQPVQVCQEVSYVEINTNKVVFNEGIKCIVSCFTSTGKLIKTEIVDITGDEYNNWISDDELMNLILTKCGFVRL